MMTSTGWDGQDHHMGAAPDDDFGQFLDMSGMGDGMQFDFNGFQANGQRDQQDALMGDPTSAQIMQQGAAPQMMHNQTPMSSAGGQHHQNPQMLPTSAPGTDSISTLDAQIQYLQQQKFHQQQRQIHEQRNAYFTHNHSVPPTPQSMEMPPGSGHFYTHEQLYDRGYHQQRMKEQQDVSMDERHHKGQVTNLVIDGLHSPRVTCRHTS